MNNPKVSVIVPIYNGERFVKRIINSLLNQSLKEIEIIIVNDGSTDNTLEEVQKFKDDSRIIIINKKNEGVSKARNIGLEHAKGLYIGFVDVDDDIKTDMYEVLYSRTKGVDVVSSRLMIEKSGEFLVKDSFALFNHIYTKDSFKNTIFEKFLIFENLDLLVSLNKLYSKKMLDNYNLRFDEQLAMEEDGMFNMKVYQVMSSIVFIDYAGYYYLENTESVTRNFINNKVLKKLLVKFHYDYKIDYSPEDIWKFKSSRLIYSIVYFIFSLTNMHITSKDKRLFILEIITNNDVQFALNHLHPEFEKKCGKFEKWVIFLLKTKRLKLLFYTVVFLSKLNDTGILKWIKKFN